MSVFLGQESVSNNEKSLFNNVKNFVRMLIIKFATIPILHEPIPNDKQGLSCYECDESIFFSFYDENNSIDASISKVTNVILINGGKIRFLCKEYNLEFQQTTPDEGKLADLTDEISHQFVDLSGLLYNLYRPEPDYFFDCLRVEIRDFFLNELCSTSIEYNTDEYEREYSKLEGLPKIICDCIAKFSTNIYTNHCNYVPGKYDKSPLYDMVQTNGSIDKCVEALATAFLQDTKFVDARERILTIKDIDNPQSDEEIDFLNNFPKTVIEYFGLYEILSLHQDDFDYFKKIINNFFAGKIVDNCSFDSK